MPMQDSAIRGSSRRAPQSALGRCPRSTSSLSAAKLTRRRFAVASPQAPKFRSGTGGLRLQLFAASSRKHCTPPLNDVASNFVDVGLTNGDEGATS
jgi:hypothetical protein